MTMQVYIYHGTTTIDLQGGGCKVLDGYYPAIAETPDKHVMDTIKCRFIGTAANARALINSIHLALKTAREQKDSDTDETSTWLYFEMTDIDSEWRSRIYDGVMQLTEKLDHNWRQGRFDFTLTLERQGFWEWAGEAFAVPLTNGNGSADTAGLAVYDCNDGAGASPTKRQFWATIDGDDVDGDLPGPVKFEITPSQAISTLIVGHYVDERVEGSYPVDILEVEDMLRGVGSGSTETNAAASSGEYVAFDLTDEETIPVQATFSLDHFRGSYIRVFAHFFTAPPDNVWMDVKFQTTETVIASASKVKLNTSNLIQSLGIVRLPNLYLSSPPDYYMSMNIYSPGAGGTLDLDAIYLVGVDSYVELQKQAVTSGTTHVIFEEWGNQRKSYIVDGSDAEIYFDTESGEGIFLQPGKDQKLFFLFMKNGDAEITWKITVKCSYRPRRLSL